MSSIQMRAAAYGSLLVAASLLAERSCWAYTLLTPPSLTGAATRGNSRLRPQHSTKPHKSVITKLQFASSFSSPLRLSESSATSFSFLGDSVSDSSTDDDGEEQQLLSYLPDAGRNLPPQIKALVMRVTKNYVYGTSELTSLPEIAALIEEEHRSRDVPVTVGDAVADVTKTGEELDEIVAEILSVAALYRLPKEITLELLKSPVHSKSFETTTVTISSAVGDSSLIECQAAFAAGGWDAVSFPMGLAIRPRTKFRFGMRRTSSSSSDGTITTSSAPARSPLSWLHRTKTLRAAAAAAVSAAAAMQPPPRRLQDRREFLKSMDAQLLLTETTDDDNKMLSVSTIQATSGQLFFPNADRGIFSLRTLRRVASKKYSTLKKKGRAGIVSYCFFNFVYYTAGILWQWPRMAVADPLTSNLSLTTLVLRKFGKVFAYLYAVSQLFKLPKLFTAVGLAPVSERCLRTMKQRLPVNETTATAILVGVMIMAWCAVAAVPVFSEYASLKRIMYLDEQLMQVYGLQPV
jgi:hypothetical protein